MSDLAVGNDDGLAHSARRHPSSIVPLLFLLLLVNLAANLYTLPLNRVIERRLCQEHYTQHDPSALNPDGSVDESLCKLDSIQQGLAWLQGIMDTTLIVGDLLATIPFGLLAEKYGHRPILWLNLVPRICMPAWAVFVGHFEHALPTRAILVSPFLSVLGGDCVLNSITYALAARLTHDYARRASYFAYMSSISYIVSLLGPSLAAATMSVLLWLPFWITICLLLLAAVMVRLLPDEQPDRAVMSSRSSYLDDEASDPLLASTHTRSSVVDVAYSKSQDPPMLQQLVRRLTAMRTFIGFRRRNLTLLLSSMLLTSLASADTKLLAQYISKRYQWTFAHAGYILSFKAIVNLLLLTLIIPTLLHRLSPRFQNRTRLDILGAQISLALSVLGAFLIALSGQIWTLVPSLPIYALGSGLPIFTYSLLKSPAVIPPQATVSSSSSFPSSASHDITLFSTVSLLKTLGSLLGAPLMAALWVAGINAGGPALGLPYFVSGACYCVAIAVVGAMDWERRAE